MVKVGV